MSFFLTSSRPVSSDSCSSVTALLSRGRAGLRKERAGFGIVCSPTWDRQSITARPSSWGGVNTAKPSQFQVYRSRSHTPPAHKWLDFICLAPYYRDTYWGNNGRHTSILDPLGGCSLRLLIQVVAKKRFSFLGIGRFLNQAYTLPCMFWKLFGF